MTDEELRARIEDVVRQTVRSMMGRGSPLLLTLIVPVWADDSGAHAFPVMLGDPLGYEAMQAALAEVVRRIEANEVEIEGMTAPGGDA